MGVSQLVVSCLVLQHPQVCQSAAVHLHTSSKQERKQYRVVKVSILGDLATILTEENITCYTC